MMKVAHILLLLAYLCWQGYVEAMAQQPQSQRQQGLSELRALGSVSGGLWLLQQAVFARPSPALAKSAKEQIASFASKIPGYGQKDIVYPKSFGGKWRCEQVVTSVQTTPKYDRSTLFLQPVIAANAKKFEYESDFIEYDGEVVRDRRLGWQALTSLYLPTAGQKSFTFWEPTDPNKVSIKTADNQAYDILVTKRSTEALASEEDPYAFGFSEFSRVTESSSLSPVPKVYGYRILARFKQGSNSKEVLGVMREYLYVTEPDNVLLDGNSDVPCAVVKSSVRMTALS